MNEGKKKASLWILGILTLILIGVIVFLTLSIINQKGREKELVDQVQALSNQKVQLENNLAKANETIMNSAQVLNNRENELKQITEQQKANETKETTQNQEEKETPVVNDNKTEDLNQEKADIIRKLLLEKMPAVGFNVQNKYSVIGKYIDEIEIYSEPYYANKNPDTDNIEQRVEWLKRNTVDRTDLQDDVDEIVAIGTVSFTTEFDKEIEKDDIIIAGNSHAAKLYKNYIVQGRVFSLEKLNNGEYRLEIGTGF